MAFEQAQIPVQKAEEFEQLHSSIERIFGCDVLARFYGRLESKGIAAREFEKILALGLLEQADASWAVAGRSAKEIYGSLALSDQALMREFYLERVEKVDPKLRRRYRRVYEYR
jgi:hypothetical protein